MGRINKAWLERRKSKTPSVQTVVDLPADALLKSVNDTAGNARNLFVTYILLSVYILLTVGATNDEQLFRDSSVAVSFRSNINLPVSRFYQFVPWMFFFVHVDLLLLFKLMADKLHALNAELDELELPEAEEYRQQLHGLPFVHWLADDKTDGFSHFITGLVVWTSLFLLPLLTLLALQIGFLPYHSAFTTHAQQTLLVLDALALLWFWPRLAVGMKRQTWRWWLPFGANAAQSNRYTGRDCRYPEHRDVKPTSSRNIVVSVVAGIVGKIRKALAFRWSKTRQASETLALHGSEIPPNPPFPKGGTRANAGIALKPSVCRGLCRTASVAILIGSVWFGGFVAVLPGKKLEDDGLIANSLFDDAEKSIANEKLSDNFKRIRQMYEAGTLHWYSKENIENVPLLVVITISRMGLFHRNLDLQEKLLVANDPDLETLAKLQEPELKQQDRLALLVKIKGLDLKNRDLRFANLSKTKLWKADLRQTKLQQADLSNAKLHGIQWRLVCLWGANLREPELQGADLLITYLQGADFWRAELQGAQLGAAELQGATLREADLQGADFWYANLQGGDFGRAELQYAYLGHAKLQGANLVKAQLQCAYLEQAQMQGADLEYAQVGSANFSLATFAFNDFRHLRTLPLFTQQDFAAWKRNGRGLKDEYAAKKWEEYFQSHVGKATEWPKEAVTAPCLADKPSTVPFQNCLAPNPDYFKALADYLGDLACRADKINIEELEFIAKVIARKEQEFIAKGIARRALGDEWGNEGTAAQRQLVQRLLGEDCAGKAGLSDDIRVRLRQLAEAPPS